MRGRSRTNREVRFQNLSCITKEWRRGCFLTRRGRRRGRRRGIFGFAVRRWCERQRSLVEFPRERRHRSSVDCPRSRRRDRKRGDRVLLTTTLRALHGKRLDRRGGGSIDIGRVGRVIGFALLAHECRGRRVLHACGRPVRLHTRARKLASSDDVNTRILHLVKHTSNRVCLLRQTFFPWKLRRQPRAVVSSSYCALSSHSAHRKHSGRPDRHRPTRLSEAA